VKGDVESLDEQNDTLSIEVKDSNHPDLWSVEGIARALRTHLGIAKPRGPRVLARSGLKVTVDKRLGPIRPYIATAIVKSVRTSENALKSWIGLQEKMDQTYGRKRKRASIGFYQSDLVKSPLRYTVADPDLTSFPPLGSTEQMTLREIVEKHPKGIEYGAIISSFKEWPLLIDGEDKILSLPPVINSNDLGKVNTETKNILVEVTGTNADTVGNTLKIVVAALAERGGKIYSCSQTYPDGKNNLATTPDLRSSFKELSIEYTNNLLGTTLKPAEISRLLARAGHPPGKHARRDVLRVESLCYRIDIMHQVDLVEDIAIALDLNKLKPEWPRIWTLGGLASETDRHETLAEIMVGMGYQELLTYSLTSPEVFVTNMGLTEEKHAELLNPKMSTHDAMRSWLLPSLLNVLRDNTHVDYPQRVFEIGPCVVLRDGSEETETRYKISAVTIHTSAGFTEIRSSLDTLLASVGLDFNVEASTHPSFLKGRTGAVKSGTTQLGFVGELHPKVIRAWGLSLPVAAFELEIPSTVGRE
jgi:phenylalanyl-tRNA synthetase beta chain